MALLWPRDVNDVRQESASGWMDVIALEYASLINDNGGMFVVVLQDCQLCETSEHTGFERGDGVIIEGLVGTGEKRLVIANQYRTVPESSMP